MSTAPAATADRLVLIRSPRKPSRQAAAIKHYKLARLRLDEPALGAGRYAHLKRSYD